MTAVFGVHRICGRCQGKGVFATTEDKRNRNNELARVARLERRSGEPMDRPPFRKSACEACQGKGYVPR